MDGNLGAAVTAAMEVIEDKFQPLRGQLPKDTIASMTVSWKTL